MSTLFTTGLTLSGGYIVKSVEQAQSDRRSEVDRFRTPAGAMDSLVTNFMDKWLKGKDTAPERKILQLNIQQQWNALADMQPDLSDNDLRLTKRYQKEIVEVSDGLDNLPAAADGQTLVQAIATARNTRTDVSERLRLRAGRWF